MKLHVETLRGQCVHWNLSQDSRQSEQEGRHGFVLWSIRALNGSGAINVTAAADKQPVIGQKPTYVEFENLEVNISKKGLKLVWFTCDSVVKKVDG